MDTHHHRPGTLKQSNKSHKGGSHSSKRAINKALHGRVEKSSSSSSSAFSSSITTKKGAKGTWAETQLHIRHSDRMNHAKQVINARKEAAAVARRLGNGNNTIGVPKSIAILGLSSFVRPESIAAQLLCSADDVIIPNQNWHQVGTPIAAVFSKFRQRISITVPPRPGQIRYDGAENILSSIPTDTSIPLSNEPFVYEITHTMTALSSVDVLLLVADMSQGTEACIDEEGDLILTALKATGVPTLLGVVTGLDVHPVSKHNDLRKHATRLFHTEFGADNVKIIEGGNDPFRTLIKLAEDESSSSSSSSTSLTLPKLQNTATVSTGTLTLVRAVCDANPRSITWRSQRSYLTAMESSWSPYEDQIPTDNKQDNHNDQGIPVHPVGTLTVSGYLRGRPLNVNQLICIPNVGTYQIEGITRPLHHPLQYMGSHRRANKNKKITTNASTSSSFTTKSSLSISPSSAVISEVAQSFANHTLSIPWSELTISDIDPCGTVINVDYKYHLPLMIALGPYAYCVRTVDVSEYYDQDNNNNSINTSNTNLSADTNDEPPVDDEEILAVPNDQIQETLEQLNPVDPLEGEQAWALQKDNDDNQDFQEDEDGENDDNDGLAPFIDKSGKIDMYAATHGLDPNDPEYETKKNQAIQSMRENELTERHRLQERRRRIKLKKQGLLNDEDEEDEDESNEENEGKPVRNVIDYDGGAQNHDAFDNNDEFGMDETGTVMDMAPTPSEVANRRASALKIAQSESADQELFPDEIDTPMEQPARERFGRYRGLKSFRTSPWHPQESLPPDYSHIFALSHFYRTQRRILGENELAEKALLSLENERMNNEKQEKKEIQHSITAKKAALRNAASGTDNPSVGTDMMNDDSTMTGGGGNASVITKSSTLRSSATDAFIPSDLSTILGAGWVSPGQYITIHLNNVPKDAIDDLHSYYGNSSFAFTVWGLLRHENRTSVVHYNITRVPTYTLPLKSREHLEFYVGSHRIFDARPVFSSGGSQLADRTKMDRYVRPNTNAIATVYGPIIYSPCPVLIFKRIPNNVIEQQLAQNNGTNLASNVISSSSSGSVAASTVMTSANAASTVFMPDHDSLESYYPSPDRLASDKAGRSTRLVLVATGTVIGSDPDKIILKRTILSGFPIKVKKRFAMVKYMFFNPDDINYFKPVELYTKYGLVGHITASVGTHGSMKCRFDQPITQADTVCMPLYKRIYPRWGNAYKSLFTEAGYYLDKGKLVIEPQHNSNNDDTNNRTDDQDDELENNDDDDI